MEQAGVFAGDTLGGDAEAGGGSAGVAFVSALFSLPYLLSVLEPFDHGYGSFHLSCMHVDNRSLTAGTTPTPSS